MRLRNVSVWTLMEGVPVRGQPRLPPGTAALFIFRMFLWLALFNTLTWLLNCTYWVKETACGDEWMTNNIVWAADEAFVQLRRLNLPQNNSEFTTYSLFFKAHERLFRSKECAVHDNDYAVFFHSFPKQDEMLLMIPTKTIFSDEFIKTISISNYFW